MSNLKALRDGGTWYPAARSLPVMETIPNHVMMMTGCRPALNGVPANTIYDRTDGALRDCSRPTDIAVTTIIEQLNASGRTTGTVLSKEYLYSVFGERATHRWEPFPVIPVSGHAPDAATMDAVLAMIDEFDPAMMFVNLGDVDRVGHSDLTGTTLKVARTAALASTNLQVGRFVDKLKSSGKWSSSMVIVLADHSMDWSLPEQTISLTKVFDADATLTGKFQIAQNGGADLVYWTGPTSERAASGEDAHALPRHGRGLPGPRHRPDALAAAGPEGRRPAGVVQGRLAVQRPRPAEQPDPGQPRPSGNRADPVLHRGRIDLGQEGRGPLGEGAHDGRRTHRRGVLRDQGTRHRLGRRFPPVKPELGCVVSPLRPAPEVRCPATGPRF